MYHDLFFKSKYLYFEYTKKPFKYIDLYTKCVFL